MSKEKRARDKLRAELEQKVVSLESRVKTAANALGREHYSKQLAEARRQLQLLN
jgi:hypothetical protein